MSEIMNVVVPTDLKEKAKALRINISQVCRDALREEVSKKEKETGVIAAKQSTPATSSIEGGHHYVIG
jgi:post-segregation antitoxin (ccd killing protein)